MEVESFIEGVFFGILVVAFIWGISHGGPLEECEMNNNVYSCEYVVVPVEPNEVDENG